MIGLGLALCVLAIQTPARAAYDVHFSGTRPLTMEVQAHLDVVDGRLLVATGGGIDQLPNQWATFVHGLAVQTAAGRTLHAQLAGPEGFQLDSVYTGSVSLQYTVDLEYATKPWPPGNEQAGLWRANTLYSVTKPIFVTSSGNATAIVRFHLPDGWMADTPWQPLPDTSNAFVARSRAELVENSIVLGSDPGPTFREGAFTLVLGLVGPDHETANLLRETLGAALHHVIGVFDQTPPSRFMLTILYTDQDDGESFETSAAIATATVPRADNRQLWGNDLAHELYHIWIGGKLHGADPSFEWFDEGFTDYYADLALVQGGLISHESFLVKMEKVMGRYGYFVWSPLFQAKSLAAASANKGRNRFGVYDGGWAAAFCLDVMIQQHTGGRRTLDDFMRTLYDRFALTARAFTLDDLSKTASDVAGADLRAFFHDHVTEPAPLPLEQCLAGAGLEGAFQQYAAELWLSPDPHATPEATAVLARIMSRGTRP